MNYKIQIPLPECNMIKKCLLLSQRDSNPLRTMEVSCEGIKTFNPDEISYEDFQDQFNQSKIELQNHESVIADVNLAYDLAWLAQKVVEKVNKAQQSKKKKIILESPCWDQKEFPYM